MAKNNKGNLFKSELLYNSYQINQVLTGIYEAQLEEIDIPVDSSYYALYVGEFINEINKYFKIEDKRYQEFKHYISAMIKEKDKTNFEKYINSIIEED